MQKKQKCYQNSWLNKAINFIFAGYWNIYALKSRPNLRTQLEVAIAFVIIVQVYKQGIEQLACFLVFGLSLKSVLLFVTVKNKLNQSDLARKLVGQVKL